MTHEQNEIMHIGNPFKVNGLLSGVRDNLDVPDDKRYGRSSG
jgi:hypothetical protein